MSTATQLTLILFGAVFIYAWATRPRRKQPSANTRVAASALRHSGPGPFLLAAPSGIATPHPLRQALRLVFKS